MMMMMMGFRTEVDPACGSDAKKSWCAQAPRVETTQGLPLGHESRSIKAEKTL